MYIIPINIWDLSAEMVKELVEQGHEKAERAKEEAAEKQTAITQSDEDDVESTASRKAKENKRIGNTNWILIDLGIFRILAQNRPNE